MILLDQFTAKKGIAKFRIALFYFFFLVGVVFLTRTERKHCQVSNSTMLLYTINTPHTNLNINNKNKRIEEAEDVNFKS